MNAEWWLNFILMKVEKFFSGLYFILTRIKLKIKDKNAVYLKVNLRPLSLMRFTASSSIFAIGYKSSPTSRPFSSQIPTAQSQRPAWAAFLIGASHLIF